MADLEEVKVFLRSLLISEKDGVQVNRVLKDFYELTSSRLPFREFGFNSIEDFIRSMPEVAYIGQSGFVHAVADELTQHLVDMIRRQKGKKKHPNPLHRYNRYAVHRSSKKPLLPHPRTNFNYTKPQPRNPVLQPRSLSNSNSQHRIDNNVDRHRVQFSDVMPNKAESQTVTMRNISSKSKHTKILNQIAPRLGKVSKIVELPEDSNNQYRLRETISVTIRNDHKGNPVISEILDNDTKEELFNNIDPVSTSLEVENVRNARKEHRFNPVPVPDFVEFDTNFVKPSKNYKKGSVGLVYVTYINSITDFYVCTSKSTIESLNKEIAKYVFSDACTLYGSIENDRFDDLTDGCVFLTKNNVDLSWYRARLSESDAFFIDSGYRQQIDECNILKLPTSLAMHPEQVWRCCLNRLTPILGSEDKCKSYFRRLADEEVVVTVVDLDESESKYDLCCLVEMRCPNSNVVINEQLVALNFAKLVLSTSVATYDVNCQYEVYVSCIISGCEVAIRQNSVEHTEMYNTLKEKIAEHMQLGLTSVDHSQIVVGQLVIVSDDGEFLRGRIRKCKSNQIVHVDVLDEGDFQEVEVVNLFQFPGHLLAYPPMCVNAIIDGFERFRNNDDAAEILQQVLLGKNVLVNVLSTDARGLRLSLTTSEGTAFTTDYLESLMPTMDKYVPTLPNKDEICRAIITCIEANGVVHLQLLYSEGIKKLERLMDDMTSFYNKEPSDQVVMEKGRLVCCQYAPDISGTWYRAEILEVSETDLCVASVKYIDYGNRELMNLSTMRLPSSKLPYIELLPPQAVKCRLGCKWKPEYISTLKNIMEEKTFFVRVVAGGDVPVVELLFYTSDGLKTVCNYASYVSATVSNYQLASSAASLTDEPVPVDISFLSLTNQDRGISSPSSSPVFESSLSSPVQSISPFSPSPVPFSFPGFSQALSTLPPSSPSPRPDDVTAPAAPVVLETEVSVTMSSVGNVNIEKCLMGDMYLDVNVCLVKNPSLIFAQIRSLVPAFLEMFNEMQDWYTGNVGNTKENLLAAPLEGRVYAVYYAEDECYYRALSLSSIAKGSQLLHMFMFIDYGDYVAVDRLSVLRLPVKFTELPAMAIKVSISGLVKAEKLGWPESTNDFLRDHTENMSLVLEIVSMPVTQSKPFPKVEARMFNTNGEDDINIGQLLVDKGMAKYKQSNG